MQNFCCWVIALQTDRVWAGCGSWRGWWPDWAAAAGSPGGSSSSAPGSTAAARYTEPVTNLQPNSRPADHLPVLGAVAVRQVVTTARLASSEIAGIGPEDEEKNKALVSKSYFEQSEQEGAN